MKYLSGMVFMNVKEVLQFVDKLVVEKTGKHLDDVQKAVIEGTWDRKSYHDIAEQSHVTEGYVGDIASELWQLLSELLDEDIKKSNFRSTLERIRIGDSQNPNICIGNHNFFFGSQTVNPSNQPQQTKTENKPQKLYYDLTLAPQIIKFYNRETELKTLADWIFNQNIRLISILGLSGIGKTALVKRLIDLNLEQFEVIIWRSLKYPQPLDLLVNDFLYIFQEESQKTIQAKLQLLFTILTEKKCLIILDDMQNIFERGELAGKYNIPYQDYQNFFTMLTATQHQSNIILISQEKCAEMQSLDQQLYPIKCLELLGLDNISILENTNLNNQDIWLKLIQLYEGNLIYLKEVVSLIQDIYDGEVADFLTENSLIITQNMQSHFNDLFSRLSPIEQQIILELIKSDQPISREDLKQNLLLSSVDFVKGLQSLQQRYVVTKIKADKILFKLSAVFREYVINSCEN